MHNACQKLCFGQLLELQIRVGTADNLKGNLSYFSMKTCGHLERVLMMGCKICFNGEIWLVIPKLSLLPLLIWSTELQVKIILMTALTCTSTILT